VCWIILYIDGGAEKQQDEWLSLIYEYNDLDGTTRQTKASNGGSSVLKYKTGQKVTLVIHHYKGEDEIYDADDKSPYVVGFEYQPIVIARHCYFYGD